jgi:hypothetical protein
MSDLFQNLIYMKTKRTFISTALISAAFILSNIISAQAQCTISGDLAVCRKDTSTYNLSPAPSVGEYTEWVIMKGVEFSSTDTSITIIWTGSPLGMVMARVRDANMQIVSECEINVVVDNPPSLEIVHDVQIPDSEGCGFCLNSTVTFCVEELAGSTYDWSTTANTVLTDDDECITLLMTDTGYFDLCIAVETTSGCRDSVCETYRVVQSPDVDIIVEELANEPYEICRGQQLHFRPSIPFPTRLWEVFCNGTKIYSNNGPLFNYSFTQAGNYVVKLDVSDGCRCAPPSDSVEIAVSDFPGVEITCPSVVCQGDTITYTADPGCQSYQWSVQGSSNFTSNGNMLTVVWDSFPAGGAGVVKLLATGCGAGVCNDTVYVDVPVLSSEFEINVDTSICSGVVTARVPNYPGAVYTWAMDSLPGSSGIGTVFFTNGSHSTTIVFNAFTGRARLSVHVEHPLAGCDFYKEIEIEAFGQQSFFQPTVCQGENVEIHLLSVPQQPYNLKWEIKERGTSNVVYTDTTVNNPDVIIPGGVFLPGQNYVYCVTLFLNGQQTCDIANTNVRILPAVPPVMHFSGPDSVCINTWYEYEVTDTLPSSIEWFVQGGMAVPVLGVRSLVLFDGTAAPQIELVRKNNGCPSDTFFFMPIIRDSVDVEIMGRDSVCYDEIAQYETDYEDGFNYSWQIVPANAGTIISGLGSKTIEVWWHDAPGVNQAQVVLDVEACGIPTQASQTVNISGGGAPVIEADPCFGDTTTLTITVGGQSLGQGLYVWNFDNGTIDTTTVASIDYYFGDLREYVVRVDILQSSICVNPNTAVTRIFPQRQIRAFVTSDSICLNPEAILLSFGGSGGIPVRYFAFLPGGTDTTGVTYKWYRNGSFYQETTNPWLDRMHIPTGHPNIGLLDDTMSVELCGLPCPGPSNKYVIPHCNEIEPPGECDTEDYVDILSYSMECDSALLTGEIELFSRTKDRYWRIFDPFHPLSDNGRRTVEIDTFIKLIDFPHQFSEPGSYYVQLIAHGLDTITGDTVCDLLDDTTVYVPMVIDMEYETTGCDGDSIIYVFRDVSRYIPDSFLQGSITREWYVNQDLHGDTSEELTIKFAPSSNNPTVQLKLFNNGINCAETMTIDVPIPDYPSIQADPSACEGRPTIFTALVNNEDVVLEYKWLFSDGSRSYKKVVEKVFPYRPQPDTIILEMTSVYGCVYIDTAIIQTLPNFLDGYIVVDTPACPNGRSLSFFKTAGPTIDSYLWSNGSTTDDIFVTEPGIYQVTITDNNGCEFVSDRIAVGIGSPAFVGDLADTFELCVGEQLSIPFIGTSEYDYRIIHNSGESFVTLNGQSIQINATNATQGDTIDIELRAQINLSVVCDVRQLTVIVVEGRKPDIIQEVIDCSPFTIRMTEQNGDTILWRDEAGIYRVASSVFEYSGDQLIIAEYPDMQRCDRSLRFGKFGFIDLSAFLDGCYDICEDSLLVGNIFLPGVPGLYNFWAYIHESGDTLASGSGTVQDLVLLPEHAGKIRLYVEREYGLTTCTAYSDPVCLIVENCGQCPNDSLSNGSATINHFTTIGGVFEVYDINVSIPLLAGYDVCNDCNASFEILDWIDGPYCQDDGNGNLVITGKAGYITGDCEGEDVLHLEMCYNGEPCPFTLPVTYVCCPELECTIWLEEEFGGDYLCIYANIDATAAEYCDDEFATIGFENFGQYLFLGQGVQNPKIVQIQAGKLNYKACFPITLEDLPLCFNITMAATGCEFWCTSQVCVGEGLTNGGVSNEAIAQCLGSNAEGDNVYNLTWALNDDDLVKSAWVQSVDGGQLEGTSVAGDELTLTISANPSVTVVNPTIYVLDTNDVNYVIDQSIVLPTCGSGGGNDPLISGGNKNDRRLAQEANLLIVPNPSDQGAIIHYNTDQTISSTPLQACIDVIGFDGQLIYRVEDITEARGQIDTRPLDLPTGVYYIILKVEGEVKSYEPMLITR